MHVRLQGFLALDNNPHIGDLSNLHYLDRPVILDVFYCRCCQRPYADTWSIQFFFQKLSGGKRRWTKEELLDRVEYNTANSVNLELRVAGSEEDIVMVHNNMNKNSACGWRLNYHRNDDNDDPEKLDLIYDRKTEVPDGEGLCFNLPWAPGTLGTPFRRRVSVISCLT